MVMVRFHEELRSDETNGNDVNLIFRCQSSIKTQSLLELYLVRCVMNGTSVLNFLKGFNF